MTSALVIALQNAKERDSVSRPRSGETSIQIMRRSGLRIIPHTFEIELARKLVLWLKQKTTSERGSHEEDHRISAIQSRRDRL